MPEDPNVALDTWAEQTDYKWGFVTDIESETLPPGLDEDVIRGISARKREPEWLLEWRLEAYRHWLTMDEPEWAHFPDHDWRPVDYQAISYYSAPKSDEDRPKSLDEVDPKLLETYEKLGIPLKEQMILAGYRATQIKAESLARLRTSNAGNPALANASGLHTARIILMVTFASGAIAGLGGGLLSLSTGAYINLGHDLLLSVFAAAILGGLGNPMGAVAGALLIAFTETSPT